MQCSFETKSAQSPEAFEIDRVRNKVAVQYAILNDARVWNIATTKDEEKLCSCGRMMVFESSTCVV